MEKVSASTTNVCVTAIGFVPIARWGLTKTFWLVRSAEIMFMAGDLAQMTVIATEMVFVLTEAVCVTVDTCVPTAPR